MTLLLILLGTLIGIFERFMTASGKSDFNLKLFFKKNWALFTLHFLTSISIYFAVFHGEMQPVWLIKSINFDAFNLVALITGAISLYVWKLLISTYKLIFNNIIKRITK